MLRLPSQLSVNLENPADGSYIGNILYLRRLILPRGVSARSKPKVLTSDADMQISLAGAQHLLRCRAIAYALAHGR